MIELKERNRMKRQHGSSRPMAGFSTPVGVLRQLRQAQVLEAASNLHQAELKVSHDRSLDKLTETQTVLSPANQKRQALQ